MRHVAPVVPDELQFDAIDLTALLDLHVDEFRRGRPFVLGQGRPGGDDRARLRHAPWVLEETAHQSAELLDRGARRRRAAGDDMRELELLEIEALAVGFDPGEEIEPDRRNATGLGAFLLLEQHVNAFGIELRTRKDHLRPAHRRRKRQAPGVGLKERHDDKKESRALSARLSAAQAAKACSTVDRWLYITPFGLPVVPDV